MTTICVRDGLMAADTMLKWNGNRAKVHKIMHTESCIIGCGGQAAAIARLREWYLAGADPASPPKFQYFGNDYPECELLILKRDGTVWHVTQHLTVMPVLDDFCAIGSGMDAALGAMHMGANARLAVEIAALVDASTGGEIETASFTAEKS